jgi:hypothetical protein
MPNTAHLGREFRVRDCYVWSEIHYLDSTTDYREYLPVSVVGARKVATDDLVMLDNARHSSSNRTFWALGVLVIFLVACWILWYGLPNL